jgi:hypothetical protein
MKTKHIIISSFVIFFLISCSKDDGPDKFSGSEKDLTDLFNETTINSLNELGFTINEGASPPDLQGTYFVSEFILTDSNILEDEIGSRFADQKYTFFNQNNNNNTIDFQGIETFANEILSTLDGTGSFISGEDNRFSIFLIVENERTENGAKAFSALAISGLLTENGIINFEQAVVMLDDFGDPFNVYIENGEGRRFVDQDGISEIVTGRYISKKNTSTGKNSKGNCLESSMSSN